MVSNHCHFCGHIVSLVHVHGHYQCPVCRTNALPCCDGDNCDTNNLFIKTENDIIKANKIELPAAIPHLINASVINKELRGQ